MEILGQLVGGHSSLRLQVLSEGKTDNSEMGRVRKCWREHLGLGSDEELLRSWTGSTSKIVSLTWKMRREVSTQFRRVAGHENETVFSR